MTDLPALSLFPEDDSARAREQAEREAAELAQRLRWAEHDADFTPPDACRLGAWGVRRHLGLHPRRVLGPCAGAGPWLVAARETWPDAELRAMDIRAEERPHLVHHVGEANVRIGDFLAWSPADDERPDLILDNLPFKFAREFIAHGLDVLAPGGWACWFVRMTLGDAEDVRLAFERHMFAWALDYVDRLKFRVGINPKTGKPYGVDSVGYRILAFHKSYRPEGYIGRRLPSLPTESRRWRKTRDGRDIRPGTEYLYAPDEIEPVLWTPPG